MGQKATNIHQLINRTVMSPTSSFNGIPCREWTGALNEGYGKVSYQNKIYTVTRLVAHIYLNFDLDSPLLVCHHCDNPLCIEPTHLFVGTSRQNTQDSMGKGRFIPFSSAKHRNAEKTHCKRGHEFTPDNTGRQDRGQRYCMACKKMHNDARYKK